MTFIFQILYRVFCAIATFLAIGAAMFYIWQWHETEQRRDFEAWIKHTGNPNGLSFEEWQRIK